MAPTAFISAFMNNTPLVAMLLPAVRRWAEDHAIAPSKLLIPLSYAAILGGMCTLVGTSTNLLVAGMVSDAGYGQPGFFDVGKVGLPAAVAGLLILIILGRKLLADRRSIGAAMADPRSFTTELVVEPQGPLIGKRLDEIRYRGMSGIHPVEIIRGSAVVPAPQGGELLAAGDRLVFAGGIEELQELKSIAGLSDAGGHQFGGNEPLRRRRQVELVISERCPLVGHRVGDGTFRQRYNAAVVAVARHGGRLPRRGLKGWRIRAGDTLLVEAAPGFAVQNRFNPDFHVVSARPGAANVSSWQAWASAGIVAMMCVLAAAGVTSMFKAALCAALAFVVLRIVRWHEARSSLDAGVLLAIAASIGLGRALTVSGAADIIARAAVSLGRGNPHATLIVLYIATTAVTEMVTNNAAAVLMTPMALAAAHALSVNYQPFMFCTMIAASASFITPVGYQTNLMVYAAGGYRFTDFARIGLPVSIAVGTVTLLLAPRIWPF
jgi:di/tricarboxylate transporter